ncbi:MAG: diphthine--ammonia ligase [Candidatus Anstonellales archaeon]
MEVLVLFSGGKDSVFSTFCALFSGWSVSLLTVLGSEESKMFHKPNLKYTRMQAEAMGLKHYFIESDDDLSGVKKFLEEKMFDGIVSGAIASEYQKQKIDMLGEEFGIPTFSFLWHKEGFLLPEVLEYFETYIVSVSAEGLGKELLGKPFKELKTKYPIHPLLEGGEGETFVAWAPFFKKKIKIEKWKITWDGIRGEAEIEEAKLIG